jgi:hypothetical protein
MKIAIELPDDLYKRAEAEAALRRCKIDDLIQEGLQLIVGKCPQGSTQSSLAELMKKARGIISSDVPDLGSNPDHLQNLGRKTRDR